MAGSLFVRQSKNDSSAILSGGPGSASLGLYSKYFLDFGVLETLITYHLRARSYHFVVAVWRGKEAESIAVKYWEIIAHGVFRKTKERLSESGLIALWL